MFNLSRLIQTLPFSERKFLRNALRREQVEFNQDGMTAIIRNVYGIRGGYRLEDGSYSPNVITLEGQLYLLSTGLAGGTAEAAWYIALWQNAVTPDESWTAANFASTAGENTSTSEGYTGNRPQWVPDTPLAEPMKNSASPAEFNIVTASSVTFQGSALVSASVRGSTSGILMSAAPFDGGPRTQYNGDIFRVVYEESLQPL
jgi:hypothetical protein